MRKTYETSRSQVAANQVTVENIFRKIFSEPAPDWLRLTLRYLVSHVHHGSRPVIRILSGL